MKKQISYLFAACLFATVLVFSSCGKDGATGPAGPAGAAGAAGAKGDKGDPGTDGTSGIIYSDWMDTQYQQDTSGVYFNDIEADKLDNTILNTGMVKIYMNFGTADNPVIVSIPYTQDDGLYIRELAGVGFIELLSNADVSTVADNSGNHRYQVRYVLVPGGSAARQSKTIDWNDYKQVKAFLHLKN
jgi:hypothetical protein